MGTMELVQQLELRFHRLRANVSIAFQQKCHEKAEQN